jgi:hypothetical protein
MPPLWGVPLRRWCCLCWITSVVQARRSGGDRPRESVEALQLGCVPRDTVPNECAICACNPAWTRSGFGKSSVGESDKGSLYVLFDMECAKMTRIHCMPTANICCLMLCGALCVVCLPAGTARGGDLRFRLQLSYVSGMQDLADQYEDNIEIEEGEYFDYVDVDTFVWPVGISASGYYQWDNGLMLGGGLGPFMYLIAEGWAEDDYVHWQLPVNATVGYVLGPNEPVSFYVRAGPSYHIASGDYYDGSNVGVFGAAGVEFLKRDNLAFGVEAAYDSAEVDIDDLETGGTKGIKAAEFSVGVFILFK